MSNILIKTPISYYGGKQQLAEKILTLIPPHNLYGEPFTGGAAIFFAKRPAEVEVLNDTNGELMNFYKILKQDYRALFEEIKVTLHSRDLHRQATVIYNNPDLFSPVKRAWAIWVLSLQSFGSILDGGWGYDKITNTVPQTVANKIEQFTLRLAKRLQNCQIESADALYIIQSRDTLQSFFYCDPPYFNSDMGHYNGYSEQDFENLLSLLAKIKGRFLLSAYPSQVLARYVKKYSWAELPILQPIAVNAKHRKKKLKTEMLVANYPFHLAQNYSQLLF
ncbi:DNA adenine methylase [Mucilaginibacter lacusdianchii]|uniref:DNA adenine methylase n=1 Tax=Mucilaginibacter lacusdianchii TaxID=2684211 RepID=UPI00131D49C1|nr:DNA adenine methylase [Mucilaginibacter sp. JXJ CY 39]